MAHTRRATDSMQINSQCLTPCSINIQVMRLPGAKSRWHLSIQLLHALLYKHHSMQCTRVGHQLLHFWILQLLHAQRIVT